MILTMDYLRTVREDCPWLADPRTSFDMTGVCPVCQRGFSLYLVGWEVGAFADGAPLQLRCGHVVRWVREVRPDVLISRVEPA